MAPPSPSGIVRASRRRLWKSFGQKSHALAVGIATVQARGVPLSARCQAMPHRGIPDWRSNAPYRALAACDAPLIAWEWLRRDPAYRFAAARGETDAGRFGLHRFEDPACSSALARVWWRRDVDPFVLSAAAAPCAGSEAFSPDLLPVAAAIERLAGAERLLVTDGAHSLRVDIVAGTLLEGPAPLTWQLPGLVAAAAPMHALARFIALCRTGVLRRGTYPTPAGARRWALLLRVSDALDAGASQRDIAEAFFGEDAIGRRWRVNAAARRTQIQRLVRQTRWLRAQPAARLLTPGALGRH
jgi:hypothetical protein